MCENTLRALEQIVDAMKEHDSLEQFVGSLSESERSAFHQLMYQIQDIAELTSKGEFGFEDKCWA